MFKKLFEINYNNKRFLILVDDSHRRTFLEVVNDKYIYPEYDDYVYLNEIYNNYDYTIKYDKYLSYKEKVRYKSLVLLASVALTFEAGYVGKRVIELGDVGRRELSIQFQGLYKDNCENRCDIDIYYDNEIITKDDVIRVINNNKNFNDYYKRIALEVLDLNLEIDPNINLRIYYENIKDMKIIVHSNEDITEGNTKNVAAHFNALLKEIHLSEDIKNDDASVAHEFLHAFHNLVDTTKDNVVFINETRGFALEEAMTQRIISLKYGYNPIYGFEQKILDYFINNLDDFDYHLYNEKGILGIIDLLKEKYPDVDIDYLVDYIDTYTQSNNYTDSIKIEPYKNDDFCMELFNIAINNIDEFDIYGSINRFKMIFTGHDDDFYNKYYNLYIEKLNEMKFSNRNKR